MADHRTPLTLALITLLVVVVLGLVRQSSHGDPVRVAVNGHPYSSATIQLDEGDWLSVTPTIRGARVRYLVEFELTGSVLLAEAGTTGVPNSAVRADSETPSIARQHQRVVRTVLVAADTTSRLLAMPNGRHATISNLHVRVLKRTPLQPWNGRRAQLALLILFVGTIGVWLVHASRERSQLVIIATAGGVLAVSSPLFGVAVLALVASLFVLGRRMQRERERRTMWLGISIGLIVLGLSGWKYSYPILGSLLGRSLGAVAVPVGVLFFILRLVDAQLRWYRRQETDVSFREYLAYVIFPATLIAGPMETLTGFREKRLARISRIDVATGAGRMVVGLGKKLLIGDFVLYRLLYGHRVALYDRATLVGGGWNTVAMLGTAFLFAAIDISAYADLAIGLARLHGYVIREDSNWPILASSLRDFWRRWHVSVMEWCMANVYVPLVIATRNTFAALFATMIVMGVWHQIAWSWLLWAAHFTGGLTLANWIGRRFPPRSGRWGLSVRVLTRAFVVCFVVSAHAFVQSEDVWVAGRMYRDFWLAPWIH